MHAPYQGLGTTARDLAGAYEVFLVSRNKIGQSLAQMVLYFELSCSGGAPSTNENGIPLAHGSTGSPRAVVIPFVLRLSKGERAIYRAVPMLLRSTTDLS